MLIWPSQLCSLFFILLCFLENGVVADFGTAAWDTWWLYNGVSGPAFWGLINPQWSLCSKGRRQSPIDIDPSKLLYDPELGRIHIDKAPIRGLLRNTGQTLVLSVDRGSGVRVNLTGGPFTYRYQFEELYIRFGPNNLSGSEHRINDTAYPAELQIYGFNSEFYANLSDAQQKPNGVAAVSVMIRVHEEDMVRPPNSELQTIATVLKEITYRNESALVEPFSVHGLLPETDYYMTYEGSTTHPGCWETVTWAIFNKPIYISHKNMYWLRQLMQGTRIAPKTQLWNVRPTQDVHHRTVRTNINFPNAAQGTKCPTMQRETYYKENLWRPHVIP